MIVKLLTIADFSIDNTILYATCEHCNKPIKYDFIASSTLSQNYHFSCIINKAITVDLSRNSISDIVNNVLPCYTYVINNNWKYQDVHLNYILELMAAYHKYEETLNTGCLCFSFRSKHDDDYA